MIDLAGTCHLAQNLARNCGWHVFPCREADKKPCTPHGFKDASADPSCVAKLWRQYPGGLIGIATGELSGISVLDVDVKHDSARAWWRQHEHLLPITRTFRTRRGGLHLYFKHAAGVRNVEGKPTPGIDVRGQSGYVISWWCAGLECLDHSPLQVWPHWLLHHFWPPKPKPQPRTSQSGTSNEALERFRRRAVERVRNAAEGQGHDILRAAARTLAGHADRAGWTDRDITEWLKDVAGEWSRVEETIAWGLANGRAAPLESR